MELPNDLHVVADIRRLREKLTGLIRVLLLLPVLLLAACSDDEIPSPAPGNGENDEFIGEARTFCLGPETSGLKSRDITLKILAPDGNVISRQGLHSRVGDTSEFTLGQGLRDGTYRLLYAEYPIVDNPALTQLADKFDTAQYGLGCRISVHGGVIMVSDGFDDEIGLTGSGTKNDPYIISSYSHLIKLLKYVNSYETNKNITPETYFKQTNPIDMEQASFECDMRYGWLPIGADTNTPFRGVYQGDELSYLWIDRPNSAGVGLFGYVYQATFDGVTMSHADISGNFAVGALAGAVISAGDDHGKSSFTNCALSYSEITGSAQSWGVGGLVGAVDMYSSVLVQKSKSDDSKVSGSYNVGGLVGGCGMFSSLTVADCTNSSAITGEYAGAGGLIGVADTLNVVACRNSGKIMGATAYKSNDNGNSYIGTGGICGGSGISWLSASTNTGTVTGADGVGGIIGSTRIKGGDGEAYLYNNTLLRWCGNSGDISGVTGVGGMCGEAQFGCYGVVNSGNITGGDYTAGIVGNTSIVVAHNAVNNGNVTGGANTAGIIGKTTWGSVALDHNYGKVSGGSHTAGIIGLAGNNTIVHYCGNFGTVAGSGLSAGLVAEIGDPRKWSAMDITECVVGSLEIVMAFAGPTIAVAEHMVEEVAKGVAVTLKVSEILFDGILVVTDTEIAVYDLFEIINPEVGEELQNSLHDVTANVSNEIKGELEAIRTGFSDYITWDFTATSLSRDYNRNVMSTLAYYETEGNDEVFNENINRRREERMEELEKAHHRSEIIHEVVAGVSIAVSTVAMVGGAVASGGAAVPFMLAGSVSAIVGGVNAITKGAMDFEENVVVISQCVNGGEVSASNGEAAGFVGVLQDNSLVTDCLNMAKIREPFVYKAKSLARVDNSMTLYCLSSDFNTGEGRQNIWHYYGEGSTSNNYDVHLIYVASGNLGMTTSDIGNPASYHQTGKVYRGESEVIWKLDWDIDGEKSRWRIGEGDGNVFPVPYWSEMRE